MLAIAVIDHRRMIIPDELNALAFVAGLVAAGLADRPRRERRSRMRSLARASCSSCFSPFAPATGRCADVEGMGLGDVKLAAVAGVWLDWADLPVAVDIAALSALAAALYGRLRGDGFDPRAKAALRRFFRASDLDLLAPRDMARRLSAGAGYSSQLNIAPR